MEISLISDTLTSVVTTQGLGFSKFILNRSNVLSLSDSSSEQRISPSAAGVRQISAVIFPVDVLAPPPAKYNNVKTAPRRLARKTRRRNRRKSLGGGGADEGDENGFLFDYDGPFGGGGSSWNGGGSGGGGSGRGWNFDGFWGANWEESSSNSFSDPAFDLVYELMCWVALSNCSHFAFKKVVRILADGFSDPTRDKVPVRLTSVY